MNWSLLGGTLFLLLAAATPVFYLVIQNMALYDVDWALTGIGGTLFFASLIGLFLVANRPNIGEKK